MIIDKYFKHALFWDYLICGALCVLAVCLNQKNFLKLPTANYSISITTDITNLSLTIAGFILTLLTVFITFKSSSKIKRLEINSDDTLFDLFFASGYYYESIKHLKNSIKSLIFIAIAGYSIKLFANESFKSYAFFFNIFGFGVIILTIWRCVLILSQILDFQRQSDNRDS